MKSSKPLFASRLPFFLLSLALLLSFSTATVTAFAEESAAQGPAADGPAKAKYVFLLIGDGMGFNSHIAGSYYQHGELGRQAVDKFPVRIAATTFMQRREDKPIPEGYEGYLPEEFWETVGNNGAAGPDARTTDSAAASTAIHAGRKTISGRLGVSGDKEPRPYELISQVAAKTGRQSGTVTSVMVSHATPAGFATHTPFRNNYSEIFIEQYENSPLSVLIGTGWPAKATRKEGDGKVEYIEYKFVGSEDIWQKILNQDAASEKFVAIAPFHGSLPPFDGMVEPSTEELRKDFAKKYRIPKELSEEFAYMLCTAPPTLAAYSRTAMDQLKHRDTENKGFVLMIEGGAIDGANHSRDVQRNAWEHVAFMKAVDAVCEWIEENSSWDEALVIVTSDHETGALWGPETYEDGNSNGVFDEGDVFEDFQPIKNHGKGKTPGAQYGSGGHTNSLVPLWAKGAGSREFLKRVRGTDEKAGKFWDFCGRYVDNTDIFHVMKAAIE